MKISVFIFLVLSVQLNAQSDSARLKRIAADTSASQMNLDAIYSRPFLQPGTSRLAIGGYMEFNSLYASDNGISDGFSMQFRRLTMFVTSSINRRIRFLTELEFEEGGREINIEFASVDIQVHPLFNLRGGIIMNPIGAFNQNHDGPKWEFIDRPLSATQIIPSTWSNSGAGIFGRYGWEKWTVAYEAYISQGFDDAILNQPVNRTFLPASKLNSERFMESNNGVPWFTSKVALRRNRWMELGVSWMGGVYNTFRIDGLVLEKKRRLDLLAIDLNGKIPVLGTSIRGEWVWAWAQLPKGLPQIFGERQHGGYLDLVQPVLKKPMLGWKQSCWYAAVRLEYVDFNVGTFRETHTNIGDHTWSVTPAISFRPSSQTVIRLNYNFSRSYDVFGNPPHRLGSISVGFSTYF